MRKRIIKEKQIASFAQHLLHAEKSKNTIKQYICALMQFLDWLQTQAQGSLLSKPGGTGGMWPWQRRAGGSSGKAIVNRDLVLAYKTYLKAQYKPRSVNAKLAALNCFFTWQDWNELKVSALNLQQQMFLKETQMLQKAEYVKLVQEALRQDKIQLALIMETMCCTGMRVSELQFVTVEAVSSGICRIDCKGKIREIFLSDDLQGKLQAYIEAEGRACGQIFLTRSGRPVNTRNIWREMKALCKTTGIAPEKVFPHNLRHLFARTYYEQTKDIVRLADLLGHSSVQTTRIYTRTSSAAEKEAVNQLALSVKSGMTA